MSFEYPVLNDDEIKKDREEFLANLKPLAPGIYSFETIKATHKIKEATGNHMMELKLKVWDQSGKEWTIFDWLVATKNMAFKTKHYWESVGHPEKYNGKAIESDFEFQSGKLIIINKKDEKGVMRAKVEDYVVPSTTKETDDDLNDDIPF